MENSSKLERIKPKDVGLPEDIDYVEELEKEAKKRAELKNYNDFEGLRGRIKILEYRGLNEYEKLNYEHDMKEYMKEAEYGDRMLIGAMKSKLGLISRLEPKMKNIKIKDKKGGEENVEGDGNENEEDDAGDVGEEPNDEKEDGGDEY